MAPRPITFQDADFPHRNAWCWSKLEGLSLRWIPYGMPRLSPHLEHSVFFLYEKDPTKPHDSGDLKGPSGTGVIVGYSDVTAPGVFHYYAVTAAHVALDGASIIMLNTLDGQRRAIELDPSEWIADLAREDIAAVDITDRIKASPDGDKVSYIPFHMFADDRFLRHVDFGIGEDGFMLGLFAEHHGVEQNMVAARFGNVSLLADTAAMISRTYQNRTFNTPCHVFDMHSRPGFSGSPVFVYRTPDGDLRELEMRATVRQMTLSRSGSTRRNERGGSEEVEAIEHDVKNNRFLKLFGIHVGQFQDQVTIKKVKKSAEKDAELKDGDTIRFPGSMTIIVPAWEISQLIEHRDFSMQRQNRRTLARAADASDPKRGAVVLESERGVVVEPETDNPSHKEDFTRLLNAAAKTPAQGD